MSIQTRREAARARRLARQNPDAPAERGAGITPEMWIVEEGTRLSVSIRFTQAGEAAPTALLPEADRIMRELRLYAFVEPGFESPTLYGFDVVRLLGYAIDLATMERFRPAMRSLDRFLLMVREESEDVSFAKAIDSLAAHLRVGRIVHLKDGLEVEAKRGAAYITALRIEEAFLKGHSQAAA
jgi:hypothetical protein